MNIADTIENVVAKTVQNFEEFEKSPTPTHWYNVIPDMKPILASYGCDLPSSNNSGQLPVEMFCSEILRQERSLSRWIEIPEEVRAYYALWRRTPLIRARKLEKALNTPARMFFKYEAGSLTGSYKLNTAIPQVFLNKLSGVRRIVGDTGSGHWGLALAFACRMFEIPCTVYMVRSVHLQKPMWKAMIEMLGAEVVLSPSDRTETGQRFLKDPQHQNGTLGIAINEALDACFADEDTKYSSGCLFNNVLIHQSIIGLEAKSQLEEIGQAPSLIIGSCGGGSNLGGLALPFLGTSSDFQKPRVVAVESIDYPKLTQGTLKEESIEASDARIKMKMYSLGQGYTGKEGYAGGLRYHGVSPVISSLYSAGIVEAATYNETEVIHAARLFAGTEGFIPAIESAFAVRHAIAEAERCKRQGKDETILFNITGTGIWDIGVYTQ